MNALKSKPQGFTLIELTLVIVITGIISGIVAIFLKSPVEQYLALARRAELSNIADTALRRISREIRTAVPNSIRLPSIIGSSAIEFLPSKAGGRYCAQPCAPTPPPSPPCASEGDTLSFGADIDSSFDILGPAINFAAGDQIIVGSTQAGGNLPYLPPENTNSIRRSYKDTKGAIGTCPQNVQITATTPLPIYANSPNQRFQVIPGNELAVTYACENTGLVDGEGTGVLRRYWAYGINEFQTIPPTGGLSALLASKISNCIFSYEQTNQRNALLAMRLEITSDNETISLYHEIHISNVP